MLFLHFHGEATSAGIHRSLPLSQHALLDRAPKQWQPLNRRRTAWYGTGHRTTCKNSLRNSVNLADLIWLIGCCRRGALGAERCLSKPHENLGDLAVALYRDRLSSYRSHPPQSIDGLPIVGLLCVSFIKEKRSWAGGLVVVLCLRQAWPCPWPCLRHCRCS